MRMHAKVGASHGHTGRDRNRRNPGKLDAFDHPPIKSGELLRRFQAFMGGKSEIRMWSVRNHIHVGKVPETMHGSPQRLTG